VNIYSVYWILLIGLQYTNINDATRISDNSYVGMKKINKERFPYESEIALFVSSESLLSDPTNHCIPVYEVLQVPDDEKYIILVMPFVRPFDDPRFETCGEIIECFRQILEVIYRSGRILHF
jgi:hypothetical protein